MLYVTQGQNNKLIVDNNHYSTGGTFHFEITNDVTFGFTEFELSATTINNRYLEFNLNVIDNPSLENLPTIIALERGLNTLKINSDITDILFVKFDEPENFEYNKDNYTATTETTFVYRGR